MQGPERQSCIVSIQWSAGGGGLSLLSIRGSLFYFKVQKTTANLFLLQEMVAFQVLCETITTSVTVTNPEVTRVRASAL